MGTFNYIIRIMKAPLMAPKLALPLNNKVDAQLIVGAAIFGVGWGVGI
jgi:uncharacterized membrane protein YedE/YeeE